MNGAQQSVILCEGYDDRAFWAGFLELAGCQSLFTPGRLVSDPWGRNVAGGSYAYQTPSGMFLRVVPCGGDRDKIRKALAQFLKGVTTHPIARLIVCWDPDTEANTEEDREDSPQTSLLPLLQSVDPEVRYDQGEFVTSMVPVQTRIALLCWRALDPITSGIPSQQTLERLVCAALTSAYPECGVAVSSWLSQRPRGPGLDRDKVHKAHAWSFMAGWYTDHGWEDFYRNLWRDARVAKELERRLSSTNAWRFMKAISQ